MSINHDEMSGHLMVVETNTHFTKREKNILYARVEAKQTCDTSGGTLVYWKFSSPLTNMV